MRERLSAYVDMHRMPEPEHMERPYLSRMWNMRFSGIYAVSAVVGVLLVGSTAAYASTESLPGDPLYPIKVDVIEPITASVQTTPEAKVAWDVTRAERRLNEAATLAQQQRLDTDKSQEIQMRLASAVSSANTHVDAIESAGDTVDALTLRSDLEARLDAHSAVLAHIVGTNSGLLAHIDTTKAHSSDLRRATQMHVADSTIQASSTATESKITEAASLIDSISPAQMPTVQQQVDNAKDSLLIAQGALESDHTGTAYVAAQAAVRNVLEASVYLQHTPKTAKATTSESH
jgi:flagellum-specific peptidoglycan hydrolase FlgJ